LRRPYRSLYAWLSPQLVVVVALLVLLLVLVMQLV